jgi:hypothetical protein
VVVNRFGPAPKSKSGPDGWGSVHKSAFSVWSAQATFPSRSLNARIEGRLADARANHHDPVTLPHLPGGKPGIQREISAAD